jgi:hypothetical protein
MVMTLNVFALPPARSAGTIHPKTDYASFDPDRPGMTQ